MSSVADSILPQCQRLDITGENGTLSRLSSFLLLHIYRSIILVLPKRYLLRIGGLKYRWREEVTPRGIKYTHLLNFTWKKRCSLISSASRGPHPNRFLGSFIKSRWSRSLARALISWGYGGSLFKILLWTDKIYCWTTRGWSYSNGYFSENKCGETFWNWTVY